jgi:hypothetical protein
VENRPKGKWLNVKAWLIWGWPWNDILLIVFNGLLALFTSQLVKVGWKQAESLERAEAITKDATLAAKRSAEAAETSARATNLALHIDRPFLVPDNFIFSDETLSNRAKLFSSQAVTQYLADRQILTSVIVPAKFTLKNYGKGPAVLDVILGCIKVVTSINEVPIHDFSECESWAFPRGVLGIGESSNISSPITAMLGLENPKAGWVKADLARAIIDSQALLVVYGKVFYRDLFDTAFFSEFFWTYSNLALLAGSSGGAAFKGPQDRNRYQ